ncbi:MULTISPECIES: type II toxin-antitoxin system RelE/ParE family toxin [Sphingomonadaceae]|uniref:type II toxin-antitoxin system RelE/ParE family toxin n=1 Tax=Sphingomonadales TaxID=204457 RepID=UPI001CCB0494|nr:type II toxin-antitoxin system RelE/ParE family toxin [Sphingobium sp. 3R8]MBA4090730.1 type II toxin-antitoxin system mRNA interferase toxin, RelE/StbE family [Sphingobium sp.]MBZ9649831.1 type II toxin-antitoxin system RelE/ParE family toxin [Sphingobium sp. 3R8]
MRLRWTADAVRDRDAIYDYVEARSPRAAIRLDTIFSQKAADLSRLPAMGRPGRVPGTRELIAHRNYILVYDLTDTDVRILRLLHAARLWPPQERR